MRIYRSAISGEYVTEDFARAHPDTTIGEEIEDDDPVATEPLHQQPDE